jgi:hypothetical protein
MRLRLRIATVLTLTTALAAPAAAHAGGAAVIKACTDGTLAQHHFSQKDYADALAHLPADVDEYTDCRSTIRRAQLGGAGGGTGGGGTSGGGGGTGAGGGTPGNGDTGTGAPAVDPLASATPAERASFKQAVLAGSAPVKLDGRPVTPGNLGGHTGTTLGDVPVPLLIILAVLALGGLGAAGLGTRRLVLGRHPT